MSVAAYLASASEIRNSSRLDEVTTSEKIEILAFQLFQTLIYFDIEVK
jgi:hypothetical protein